MKRTLAWTALAAAALVVSAAAFVGLVPFPEELLDRGRVTPLRVLDREGRLLRLGLSPDRTRGRWVPLAEISPWLVEATIVAEDRRFREHGGVDPLAIARAARDDAAAGRILSGASTITMQLVRLLRPRPRSWWGKLEEAVLAIRLERRLSKEAILEEYLNRAPYGGNIVGAEEAARRTFGKSARHLSPGEAALLAGLPQSPARLDPFRRPQAARARQEWILGEMRRLGRLTDPSPDVAIAPLPPPCEAETFVDWALPDDRGEVRTTLDLELQRWVEGVVRQSSGHLERCGAGEAAVVVVENASGGVLAFAGPAARRRSPGSTLKPLVYALAIELGRTPASPCQDEPVHFQTPTGDFSPRNYDGTYRGRVTLREALANSLNVPAVVALHDVGMERFVRLAAQAGLAGIDPDPRKHGLGIVIGNASVSAVELAGAYALLARGGVMIPPHGRPGISPGRRLLSPAACYLIADILSDDTARALAFGTGTDLSFAFRVSAKTGTSPDHRDNWVAGFTSRHTVVVWVGNADGHPLRGTSGVEGAGPIFHAVMERLEAPWVDRPPGIVEREICAESGLLPREGCPRRIRELFPEARVPTETCRERSSPFRLETPQPWDRFHLDPEAPKSSAFLVFRAHAPEEAEIEWCVDGGPVTVTRGPHEIHWPASIGGHELRVRCGADECVRRFAVR
jgi:penicillin-binding protein 1C